MAHSEITSESGIEGLIPSTMYVSESEFNELLRILDEPPRPNPRLQELFSRKSVLERQDKVTSKKEWQECEADCLPGTIQIIDDEIYIYSDYDDIDNLENAELRIVYKDGVPVVMRPKTIWVWVHSLWLLEPSEMPAYGGPILHYSGSSLVGQYPTEEKAIEEGKKRTEGTNKRFNINKVRRAMTNGGEMRYQGYELVETAKKDV